MNLGYATSSTGDVWGLKASFLLHCVDRDGHLPLPGEDAAPLRDLQVHHGAVPVLQEQYAAMAKLFAAQPKLQ